MSLFFTKSAHLPALVLCVAGKSENGKWKIIFDPLTGVPTITGAIQVDDDLFNWVCKGANQLFLDPFHLLVFKRLSTLLVNAFQIQRQESTLLQMNLVTGVIQDEVGFSLADWSYKTFKGVSALILQAPLIGRSELQEWFQIPSPFQPLFLASQ